MVQTAWGQLPALDIYAACSAFIYMSIPRRLFAQKSDKDAGIRKRTESRILDWTDKGTCVIFGVGRGRWFMGEGENYLHPSSSRGVTTSVIKIPNFPGSSPFIHKRAPNALRILAGARTFN
jgi:3-oxoacyl-[acyl-carrier-protein] synthase III